MPKGPRGEKRPGDVIGAAIMFAHVATDEAEETTVNEARQRGGKAGGAVRSEKLDWEA